MQLVLNYITQWRIKSATNYQFTKEGECINTTRGRIIKRVLIGSTVGYCIKGKFISLKKLRNQLELIPKELTPF